MNKTQKLIAATIIIIALSCVAIATAITYWSQTITYTITNVSYTNPVDGKKSYPSNGSGRKIYFCDRLYCQRSKC